MSVIAERKLYVIRVDLFTIIWCVKKALGKIEENAT